MCNKFFLILIVSLLLLTGTVSGELVMTFSDLARPTRIMVDEDRLYIVEFPHIYIYSIENRKLVKKIGNRGEGPMEFMGGLNLLPYDDHIIINSQGKITYWTKTGEFIKEVKCPFANGVEPCEDVFVGFGFKRGNDKVPFNYQTIDVYDKNFKKLREVDRKKTAFQNRGLTFYSQNYFFYIMENNKIVVTGHDGFLINVFDKNGKKLFEIKRDYVKKKVGEADKQRVHEFFKTNPRTRNFYEANKHLLKFADYFPAIQVFQPFGDKLFVSTFNEKDGKTEFIIFDKNGKFVDQVWLPIIRRDVQSYLPYTVSNNLLYRLVENEVEEEWELHIDQIKGNSKFDQLSESVKTKSKLKNK